MLTSKKHSLALVVLVLTSTVGYANVTLPKKPIEKKVTLSKTPLKKPATFIIHKRDKARKRDVSILRALWNDLKCGLGVASTVAGGLGVSEAAAAYVLGFIVYPGMSAHLGTDGRGKLILPENMVFGLPLNDSKIIGIATKEVSPLVATAILAGSAGLVYLGYRVIKNSFASMRNEYVESYFGITNPDQIQYRGETTD